MPRPAIRLWLRPTLVTAIVGLVLFTASAIGAGAGILTLMNTRMLIDQVRMAAVAAAAEGVRQLFEDAPRITGELAIEAQRGVLPLDQRGKLAASFAERLVGNIGTPDRFAYTVIGDEVNLASRLEGLNKAYGTSILATDCLMSESGPMFQWRCLDRVAVKGRQQGTLVCELLGTRELVQATVLEARDTYERALKRYFAADFAGAASLFQDAALARPDDRAAPAMLDRCRHLAAAPPPDWDGVHVMHEK